MTQKTAGPKNLHCSMKFLRLLPCYCFNYFQRSPTIKAAFRLKCVIHKHVGVGWLGLKFLHCSAPQYIFDQKRGYFWEIRTFCYLIRSKNMRMCMGAKRKTGRQQCTSVPSFKPRVQLMKVRCLFF